MYDDLIKRLRAQAEAEKFFEGEEMLYSQAADAIEELAGFLQEAERDRDEYRERLDKANDVIEELVEERDAYRKAMTDEHNRAARLVWDKEHCWIPVTERLPEVRTWVLCFCRANSFDVFRMTDEGNWATCPFADDFRRKADV